MNDYLSLTVFLVLLTAGFAVAWRRGYLQRFADYVQQTKEELRKCTWPTWEELKGSTVLVMISVVLMGVFTTVVDVVVITIVQAII
jgi:preprotein translocase subunit SecE